jgi:hypothetical protein
LPDFRSTIRQLTVLTSAATLQEIAKAHHLEGSVDSTGASISVVIKFQIREQLWFQCIALEKSDRYQSQVYLLS